MRQSKSRKKDLDALEREWNRALGIDPPSDATNAGRMRKENVNMEKIVLFQKGGRGKQSPFAETEVTFEDFDLSALKPEDLAKVKLSYVRGLAMTEFSRLNAAHEATKDALTELQKNLAAVGVELPEDKIPAALANLIGEKNVVLSQVTSFHLDIASKLAAGEESEA